MFRRRRLIITRIGNGIRMAIGSVVDIIFRIRIPICYCQLFILLWTIIIRWHGKVNVELTQKKIKYLVNVWPRIQYKVWYELRLNFSFSIFRKPEFFRIWWSCNIPGELTTFFLHLFVPLTFKNKSNLRTISHLINCDRFLQWQWSSQS